jgi:hypothetical protein
MFFLAIVVIGETFSFAVIPGCDGRAVCTEL